MKYLAGLLLLLLCNIQGFSAKDSTFYHSPFIGAMVSNTPFNVWYPGFKGDIKSIQDIRLQGGGRSSPSGGFQAGWQFSKKKHMIQIGADILFSKYTFVGYGDSVNCFEVMKIGRQSFFLSDQFLMLKQGKSKLYLGAGISVGKNYRRQDYYRLSTNDNVLIDEENRADFGYTLKNFFKYYLNGITNFSSFDIMLTYERKLAGYPLQLTYCVKAQSRLNTQFYQQLGVKFPLFKQH